MVGEFQTSEQEATGEEGNAGVEEEADPGQEEQHRDLLHPTGSREGIHHPRSKAHSQGLEAVGPRRDPHVPRLCFLWWLPGLLLGTRAWALGTLGCELRGMGPFRKGDLRVRSASSFSETLAHLERRPEARRRRLHTDTTDRKSVV